MDSVYPNQDDDGAVVMIGGTWRSRWFLMRGSVRTRWSVEMTDQRVIGRNSKQPELLVEGLLPDAAVVGRDHGGALLAAEGGGEAGLVDDGSVGSEVVG